MNRGLFWCVGLSIVTSDGLAGLLQWRAISPVMKAQRSAPRCLRDNGERASASLNVCNSVSVPRDSGNGVPGGGDKFLGRGDNLPIRNGENLSKRGRTLLTCDGESGGCSAEAEACRKGTLVDPLVVSCDVSASPSSGAPCFASGNRIVWLCRSICVSHRTIPCKVMSQCQRLSEMAPTVPLAH